MLVYDFSKKEAYNTYSISIDNLNLNKNEQSLSDNKATSNERNDYEQIKQISQQSCVNITDILDVMDALDGGYCKEVVSTTLNYLNPLCAER